MAIQHALLTDPYIHEPKGINAAVSGAVYTADGVGSGQWLVPAGAVDAVIGTPLLDASSPAATQYPSGLNSTTAISFGAAQGTVSDPIMLSALGEITFNRTMTVIGRTEMQFGRLSGSGTSILHFRGMLNGSPIGRCYTAMIANTDLIYPHVITFVLPVTSGDVLTFEMVRDPAGNNNGGLIAGTVTATGWAEPSPCARTTFTVLVPTNA